MYICLYNVDVVVYYYYLGFESTCEHSNAEHNVK